MAGNHKVGQPSEPSPDLATLAAYVAALDVASETQLAAVLQRLVDIAREVIPSKYAALGVSDEHGRITEFITSGITALERARIGPIPQGHGMLGALIRERQPLIIPNIADDARSVGFPPNHPPMHTLLGVPILLGDRVLGNLYLTERLEQPYYDAQDLRTVQTLAAHAASAIDRAQLFAQVEESRRHAEASRRHAEEQRDQLRTIFNSLPSAVLITSQPDGVVEFANATAYDVLALDAEMAFSAITPENHVRFHQADGLPLPRSQWPDRLALRGEVVRNRQLLVHTQDGQFKPVLVQAVPLRNREGVVVQAVMVLLDITRMREAEQLRDDFLALVSHEFRTPLTAIHGGAQLLLQRGNAIDAETRDALLGDIVTESTILEQMLANMLTLTAIQAGRLGAVTEPILLSAVIRQAEAIARARAKDHHFDARLPSQLPPAEGDAELLDQVLRNLYENASKYSPAGTTITTSVTVDEDSVSIHVADQGSGIATEAITTVFERFRRPGADPTVRGMGLGLYLSRHLIEAQGGRIAAQSDGPGKGATFTVSLPVSREWSAHPDCEG